MKREIGNWKLEIGKKSIEVTICCLRAMSTVSPTWAVAHNELLLEAADRLEKQQQALLDIKDEAIETISLCKSLSPGHDPHQVDLACSAWNKAMKGLE